MSHFKFYSALSSVTFEETKAITSTIFMKARELMDEINKELEVNNDTSEDQPSSMNNSE